MTRTRLALSLSGVLSGVLLSLGLSGTARADAGFSLKVEAPEAQKGKRSVARVVITPGSGYHMNKDYPTALSLAAAPAGVSVEKSRLSSKDAARFEEGGATFEVAFTAADAGKKELTGELKFAVCSATTCDPKKEKVTISLDVK